MDQGNLPKAFDGNNSEIGDMICPTSPKVRQVRHTAPGDNLALIEHLTQNYPPKSIFQIPAAIEANCFCLDSIFCSFHVS